MDLIFVLLIAAGALVLGGVGGYLVFRYVLKGKYREMVDNAEKQAEVIKEKKLLEVKESSSTRRVNSRRKCSSATSTSSRVRTV